MTGTWGQVDAGSMEEGALLTGTQRTGRVLFWLLEILPVEFRLTESAICVSIVSDKGDISNMGKGTLFSKWYYVFTL